MFAKSARVLVITPAFVTLYGLSVKTSSVGQRYQQSLHKSPRYLPYLLFILVDKFVLCMLHKVLLATQRYHIRTVPHQRYKGLIAWISLSSRQSLLPFVFFLDRATYYYHLSSPFSPYATLIRPQSIYCSRGKRYLPLKAQTTHRYLSIMATTTPGDSDDLRQRKQQPMLASQRAKQSNTPTETNRTAKFEGYFPLGYKEGFSQWVSNGISPFLHGYFFSCFLVGWYSGSHCRTCCNVLYSIPPKASYPRKNRHVAARCQWIYNAYFR